MKVKVHLYSFRHIQLDTTITYSLDATIDIDKSISYSIDKSISYSYDKSIRHSIVPEDVSGHTVTIFI